MAKVSHKATEVTLVLNEKEVAFLVALLGNSAGDDEHIGFGIYTILEDIISDEQADELFEVEQTSVVNLKR